MLELGRLVLEAPKFCENIASLNDCRDPSNFHFVIESLNDHSGWNEDEGTHSDDSKLAMALLTMKDFSITYCNSTKMVLKIDYLAGHFTRW